MVQAESLKRIIEKKGYNVETVAESVGMDRSTLYRKLQKGKGSFSIKEAQAISKFLDFSSDEIDAIFFNQ